MPEYFPTGDSAREYIAQQENPFPDHERLLEEYPPLPDVVPIVFRGERKNLDIDPPAPIVVKALDALKKSPDSPKRILDIGSDTGRHSLYLAQHGYTVVGVDTNGGALEMAREAARTLGIPNKYFIPREMDAKDLPSTERYDAVISSMVMHFVDRAEGRQMVRQMQDLTVDKGLNVVSVYTDDNPEEERRRGIRHFYEKDELKQLYIEQGWGISHYSEGPCLRPMARFYKGWSKQRFQVPYSADILAMRTAARSAGRLALFGSLDPEYCRRSDPEYYDMVMNS